MKTKENFDKSQYVGRWYEYARDWGILVEFGGHCTTATYTAQDNGDIGVVNRLWLPWFFLSYYAVSGSARCQNSGTCFVNFSGDGNMEGSTNYNVLDTDYTSYSIVYSCRSTKWYEKEESLWVLTRDTTISESLLTTIKDKIKEKVPEYNQDWWLTYPK